MAEIKIKEKQPIWPWILLAAVILALLYFLFLGNDDDTVDDVDDAAVEMTSDDVDDVDDGMTSQYAAADSEIASYVSYIDNDAKMGIDHVYTNNALIELIDATQSLSKKLNVDVDADLNTARQNATSVTKDPYEVDHADKIKNAGGIIVKALKTIQSQKFPDLSNHLNELEKSIAAIEPATKTLEQKDAVNHFFDQAGDLLTKMKNR